MNVKCKWCGQDIDNASMMCAGSASHAHLFDSEPETSQLDRIEKRQTDDYNSLDARLTQLVLNTSAQLSDIEAKLDRLIEFERQRQWAKVRNNCCHD